MGGWGEAGTGNPCPASSMLQTCQILGLCRLLSLILPSLPFGPVLSNMRANSKSPAATKHLKSS